MNQDRTVAVFPSSLSLHPSRRRSDMHEGNGEVGRGPFGLHTDAWGRLVLTEPGGRQHVGLTPVRAFPISAPEQGLALCDTEGREVWWVEALHELPPQLRRLLEEELGRRQFMPIIHRVLRISAPVEPSLWEIGRAHV